MKKITLFFGLLLLAAVTFAQAPQAFKYQAVARDTDGDPIVNHQISVKISILSGSASGPVVYSELHEPTTNNMGLFDLEVGNPGLLISGNFSEIDWGSATYFLKLEMDENGGLSFHLMGISQLLSVPYALYAREAGNSETFTAGNGININGNVISNTAPDQTVAIAGGTGITTGGTYPNFSITNVAPDQTVSIIAGTGISKSGTYPNFTIANSMPDQTVTITPGNGISKSGTYPNFTIANSLPDQTVTITPGTGITKSGTYPNFTIANSLPDQTVNMQGTGAAIVTGTYPNFTVNSNPADTCATNEIQQLSKAGNLVTLSKDGGSFTDENTTYTAGTGLQLTGTTFCNTAPDQTVSITAGTGITKSGTYPNFTVANSLPDQVVTVEGTGAATVSGTYPNFTVNSNPADTSAINELQVLAQNGNEVTLSKGGGTISVADNDNDPVNELQSVTQTDYNVSLSQGGGSFMTGVLSYTQAEIDAMTPYNGFTVINTTTNCVNYYVINNWFEACGKCTPKPTIPDAGPDQFGISGTSTTLAANTPLEGTGLWAIVSGEGGIISAPTNPNSNFTGMTTSNYLLTWTISNSCSSFNDTVNIRFWICGDSITVNHVVTGGVAPVNKSVSYGTVTNIPGEPSKCWITSNLGADHQATVVDDATEASAGWYWQFNRKQGYKHDGTTRTPNTAWITSINENSDWTPTNNPCTIEIGTGWRIPTYTEWVNVDANGNWNSYIDPWNSNLKIIRAGFLSKINGTLNLGEGYYWSSTEYNLQYYGFSFYFGGNSTMLFMEKSYGLSLRCVRE